MKTSLQKLSEFGQSPWLDYISRSLLDTGKLQKLITEGLRGMTSNPSIFNQSIATTNEYDEKIIKLKEAGKSTFEIYDELTIKDIQDACDTFEPVFETTQSLDGYVSLEINPQLANQVEEQAKEGARLFKKVNRPNVMIKVPSTQEGLPVVEELISQGINVNVTLIFSLQQYEGTVNAYFKGLTRLAKQTNDCSHVRSVASVFVSRVDTFIDKTLDEKIAKENNPAMKARLKALQGKAAVANSRIIFKRFQEFFDSADFKALSKKKANLQRLLWGSTSTKNPTYPDIKYVTELIAKPTVNTLPEKTLLAFLEHGEVKDAFGGNADDAANTIQILKEIGVDIDEVCRELLKDGVLAFVKSFEELLKAIEKKAQALVSS